MSLFSRRKKANNNKVPKEVKDYYASEHRERVGLAWLVAFISLIVTVAIILALFFGGRWLYRTIVNGTDDNGTETTETEQTTEPTPDSEQEADDTTLPGDNNNESSSGQDPTTETPATGDSLTATGPAGMLTAFAASTIAGVAVHNLYARRKKV